MNDAPRHRQSFRKGGRPPKTNSLGLEASFELDLDLGVEEAIVVGPQGNYARHPAQSLIAEFGVQAHG